MDKNMESAMETAGFIGGLYRYLCRVPRIQNNLYWVPYLGKLP